MALCPCCSSRDYEDCCAPFLEGFPVPTAESLVRARYTAFSMRNLDFVDKTHAPEIKDDFNRAEAERLAEECQWQGLRIHSVKESEDTAEIEYVVQFKREKKLLSRATVSRFRREQNQWLFVGSKPAAHVASIRGPKIGRNEPCPCHSGKKYKKCCNNSAEL